MTATYSIPSIAAIIEDCEDERQQDHHHQQMVVREKDADTFGSVARRQSRSWFDSNMSPYKANTGKEREKEKSRRHRSSTSERKHQPKPKSKSTATASSRRTNGSGRDPESPRTRHRRRLSNHSGTSSTSSSEDEEPVQDHRAVLAAARARLTSPSMASQITALTSATNKSSGSSGSNSTVTQASVTKRSNLGKRPEIEEAPLSPAVPDAPDVFAFLETDSIAPTDEQHGSSESESDSDEEENEISVQWPPSRPQIAYVPPGSPRRASASEDHDRDQDRRSSSSSTSSSLHDDDDEVASLPTEHDTDRSTSPEQSVKGHDSEHEGSTATDPVSVKIASQMAAAQQRQNRYESMHQYGKPNLSRVNTSSIPQSPSSALTPRFQGPPTRHMPSPGDPLPVTGYELLASRLSCHNPDPEDGAARIKPMYRKFEALNHRVLLHLQDEISELEEQLHRLDHADTQARRTERQIVPASRRAAAQAGGELQWHKTDVLGKIGYKLAQYNQALSSFNTTQSLNPPDPEDISTYRTYLQTETPIVELETHFLDPTDDLVSVCSDNPRVTPSSHRSASYAASSYSNDGHSASNSPPSTSFPASPIPYDIGQHHHSPNQNQSLQQQQQQQQSTLPGLATAIAVSILVPILTFNVIPGFVGRLTVTLLVALGVVGALLQSSVLSRRAVLGMESVTCAGIYGGVMIIIAGIMA